MTNSNKNSVSFVYFGSPHFSTFVLDELARGGFVPSLVVTVPDEPTGRAHILTPTPVKTWALSRNIPVLTPARLNSEFIYQLQTTNYKLFIVAAYGKMIPAPLLSISKHGVLNVHPSLLPKYRGPTPVQTQILHGEDTAGVSIILLDEEMDHGPILAQKKVAIDEKNRVELDEVLWHEGGRLLVDVIPRLLEGTLEPVEQNHAEATFTTKFTIDDAFIDSRLIIEGGSPQSLAGALRAVRALNPEPGTWTMWPNGQGVRVKIHSATITPDSNYGFSNNTIMKLVPIRVTPAGKKEMSWDEFLRGRGA